MNRNRLIRAGAAFVAAGIYLAFASGGCRQENQDEMTAAPPVQADQQASATNGAAQPAGASQARLYEGFGNYKRPVTTSSPEAQAWFDQGIQLLYGFNHDEAIRSFQKAADIDPDCPMAWWGVAYANGLHINNPVMGEAKSRAAYAAAQEAMKRIDKASPVEQALIRAVDKRYAAEPPQDRRPLDEAYAAAMEEAWKAFPNDPDVGSLFAESLMNLQPWDYWTHDGQPKGRINDIVAAIEKSLEIRPDHPGANHFYIHAVEASNDPDRATVAAERLGALVPGSGHLVHMPSHIFIRTGRYADAAQANVKAAATDEAYFAIAPKPEFYSLYYLHNLHFLAYASMMAGHYQDSLEAAHRLETQAPEDFVREYVTVADGVMPAKLHVLVRFGKWNEILSEPEPPEYRLLSRAIWRYARGVALANLGRPDEAARELTAFDEVAAKIDDTWFVGNNPASVIIRMARGMLAGEMAYKAGRVEEGFTHLRDAVKAEDELVYDEPPGWMQPVRHALGALLLDDGRFAEAEEVFRKDLAKHPNNGWSLLGLEQALAGLGKTDELAQVAAQRQQAWANADVTPPSSCYCKPE
jgi:tetratricopeptide (TPR) repeat protein